MDLIPIQPLNSAAAFRATAPSQEQFAEGRIFAAQVLQLLDGGSVVLGIGRERIAATSQAALQVGQKLLLKARGSGAARIFELVIQDSFLAGAELDPDILRTKLTEVGVVGLVSFLAPFLGCAALAYYVLGWDANASWLCGIALSTTSMAVVYAVMLDHARQFLHDEVAAGLEHGEVGPVERFHVGRSGVSLRIDLAFQVKAGPRTAPRACGS